MIEKNALPQIMDLGREACSELSEAVEGVTRGGR